MRLLPWVRLRNIRTGACYTLADNCYTLAMIRRGTNPRPSASWETGPEAGCDDCCPSCIDSGETRVPNDGGAWWGDPTDPAANEFFGLLVDTIELENGLSSRRRGTSTTETKAYTPRQLEITGRIVASSEQGTSYGWGALSAVLSDMADVGGDMWSIEVHPFCPSDGITDDIPALTLDAKQAPPVLLVDPDACGPCSRQDPMWTPDLLGADDPVTPYVVDSGLRRVMNVRLAYMDRAANGTTPAGDGDDVVLVFDVLGDQWLGEEFALDGSLPLATDHLERARPFVWGWGCRTYRADSGAACDDDPLLTGGAPLPTERLPLAPSGSYSFPLWRFVSSVLVPGFPTRGQVGTNFQVTSGLSELRNLTLEIWPAYEGMPDPATCEGERAYRAIMPEWTGEIGWLPAGSRLVIDGGAQRIIRSCNGGPFQAAPGAVSGRLGAPYVFSDLDPMCRYWVVATADALNTSTTATLDLSFTPRFRS